MNDATTQYAERLESIVDAPELAAELETVTGESWTHPYFREVPNHVSLNDLERLRELQRMILDPKMGKYISTKDFGLLTAEKVTWGRLNARIPVSEARTTYAKLPEIERQTKNLR
jgi:hypothetical protein